MIVAWESFACAHCDWRPHADSRDEAHRQIRTHVDQHQMQLALAAQNRLDAAIGTVERRHYASLAALADLPGGADYPHGRPATFFLDSRWRFRQVLQGSE